MPIGKDYRVVIEGSGEHHASKATDIDKMVKEFAAELKKAGHKVDKATLELVASDDRGDKTYRPAEVLG